MSNKAKKTAKEVQRLQDLYQSDDAKESAKQESPMSTDTTTVNVETINKHAVIKRELMFLVVLIIVMTTLLFAINSWVSKSNLLGERISSLL